VLLLLLEHLLVVLLELTSGCFILTLDHPVHKTLVVLKLSELRRLVSNLVPPLATVTEGVGGLIPNTLALSVV